MKSILDYPVKPLYQKQLQLCTKESVHAEIVLDFDPRQAVGALNGKEGYSVVGADYGGDKGVSKLYRIESGSLRAGDGHDTYVQGDSGRGYLASFEGIAQYATAEDIPVGISWGAPLEGTKPLFHPKMKEFLSELGEQYDGDLANVLPTMKACINDGPAGLIGGAVEAYKRFGITQILFPINGGGLGIAALKDGKVYSTETGHIEAIAELNTYDQKTPCGVFGAEYVCLETVGANKAGIETQWQQARGEYKRAIDIEAAYKEGDEFAGELYEHSAFVVAHMIAGAANALSMNLSEGTTAIVAHGGGFKFPSYGDRVRQILENEYNTPINFILTHDYVVQNSNACLEGAAIAALVS